MAFRDGKIVFDNKLDARLDVIFHGKLSEKLMFGVLLKKLFQRNGVGTMVAKYAIGVHVENNTRTSFQQKQEDQYSEFETQAYTSSRKKYPIIACYFNFFRNYM